MMTRAHIAPAGRRTKRNGHTQGASRTQKFGGYSWASVGRVIAHLGEDPAPWGMESEIGSK